MSCSVIDRSHSPGRLRKGMCRKHYERALKHGDPLATKTPTLGLSVSERFWMHVVKGDGCWLWDGAWNPETGYGHWSVRGGSKFITHSAHRWAYVLTRGPLAEGMVPDHLCRNRLCVRPDHLEAVTQRENTLRSPIAPAAVNARKTECVNGHKLEGDNVYRPPKNPGHRHCRKCARERRRVRSAL